MFNEALASNASLATAARSFASFWPIFRVDEVTRLGLYGLGFEVARRERWIKAAMEAGARNYEPRCWQVHQPGTPPVDWPHTLKALYRVRCNLFHGQKGAHVQSDREIVHSAFGVLMGFLAATRRLRKPGR